jgi:hypothetical protein
MILKKRNSLNIESKLFKYHFLKQIDTFVQFFNIDKSIISGFKMQQTEQKFTQLFEKEQLKSIDFYSIDGNYLSFDEKNEWIFRGGIEFIFESYTISIGWNNEMHLNEMVEGELDDLIGELDVYDLELGELATIEKLKGQKVKNIDFKWTFYQEMDEEMELTDEKTYIPQELKLEFEDGTKMQVAGVVFQVKDNQIHNPVYDPQSMLMITVDKEVEIAEMEE